tara:strand:- start:317440 stop:317763 length:324 start_codon:yes stop_codon:yes gene_type:complete
LNFRIGQHNNNRPPAAAAAAAAKDQRRENLLLRTNRHWLIGGDTNEFGQLTARVETGVQAMVPLDKLDLADDNRRVRGDERGGCHVREQGTPVKFRDGPAAVFHLRF